MSEDINKILSKVQRLLKLAEHVNTNPEEAANAAAQAQALMAKYEIEESAARIASDTPKVPAEAVEMHTLEPAKGRIESWRFNLANGIAYANACRAYYMEVGERKTGELRDRAQREIGLLGRKTDVQNVRYLYMYLCGEVDRITTALAYGRGRSYSLSFRLGMVETIVTRVRAQKAETVTKIRAEHQNNSSALVIVNKAIAEYDQKDAVTAEVARKTFTGNRGGWSGKNTGREAGREAGKRVMIGNAKGALK